MLLNLITIVRFFFYVRYKLKIINFQIYTSRGSGIFYFVFRFIKYIYVALFGVSVTRSIMCKNYAWYVEFELVSTTSICPRLCLYNTISFNKKKSNCYILIDSESSILLKKQFLKHEHILNFNSQSILRRWNI